MFPNMKMQFFFGTASPPQLTMSPAGLVLTPTLEAQAFVVFPNSSLVPLFLLEMVSYSRVWADGEPWTELRARPSGSGPAGVSPTQIPSWTVWLQGLRPEPLY